MLSVSKIALRSYLMITIGLLNVAFGTAETNATAPAPQQMEVKVYYEALCPDSIRFIRHQLYNVMITQKMLKYTDLKFIPYGKVSKWINPMTNEKSLICQHGRKECEQNALQACIVEHNTPFEQVQMIDCLIGRYPVNECSTNLEIDITAALECRRERTIEDILQKYGKETDAIDIWFVPSIGIDGVFEANMQNRILNQFLNVFCEKYKQKFNILPPNCSK